uniref:Uncharacterized protein n=1 Tax=Anguilla anguilla TaxID=7936 RepID=A0A0E9UJA9_ANGAN
MTNPEWFLLPFSSLRLLGCVSFATCQ